VRLWVRLLPQQLALVALAPGLQGVHKLTLWDVRFLCWQQQLLRPCWQAAACWSWCWQQKLVSAASAWSGLLCWLVQLPGAAAPPAAAHAA
jgi:hypothetical protein